MKKIICHIPLHIRFLIVHYLSAVFIFSLFRLVLWLTSHSMHGARIEGFPVIFKAFLIGVQFDSVVTGYILSVPFILLSITAFTRYRKMIFRASQIFIFVFMVPAFFICAADIPYFQYSFSRLSSVVFNWMPDRRIIISMILEEPMYWVYFFIFIIISASYLFFVMKIQRRLLQTVNSCPISSKIIVSVIAAGLIFLAVRGRIDSPIRINHSFFCNNSFYNQLGLNPAFTLLKSMAYDRKLNVMEEDRALRNVSRFFKAGAAGHFHSPIARVQTSEKEPMHRNIVLIIMESMSADYLNHFGNSSHLTPSLDSLCRLSLCFNNIFTAGRHTYNGVFSTLYSFPAIFKEHIMSSMEIKRFSGFPGILKSSGYSTVYFTTHSETFDNAKVFLSANYFDKVVSQKDYDKKSVQGAFGVPDHVMFEFALAKLDGLSTEGSPFFATLLTTSNHPPYAMPQNIPFQPRSKSIAEQFVEYSDWAIGLFMKKASEKEWFRNTLFVFVADHGANTGNNPYEIPLSYHHTPLIMYSPDTAFIQHKEFDCMGTHMDIFPTVMGLLHFSFVNNTMGINLLTEQRPFTFFSADDKIGCIDNDFFYIYRINGTESLIRFSDPGATDQTARFRQKSDSMKTYCLSMTVAAKWLISNNKTAPENKGKKGRNK